MKVDLYEILENLQKQENIFANATVSLDWIFTTFIFLNKNKKFKCTHTGPVIYPQIKDDCTKSISSFLHGFLQHSYIFLLHFCKII